MEPKLSGRDMIHLYQYTCVIGVYSKERDTHTQRESTVLYLHEMLAESYLIIGISCIILFNKTKYLPVTASLSSSLP
jgi:hypothetical protein